MKADSTDTWSYNIKKWKVYQWLHHRHLFRRWCSIKHLFLSKRRIKKSKSERKQMTSDWNWIRWAELIKRCSYIRIDGKSRAITLKYLMFTRGKRWEEVSGVMTRREEIKAVRNETRRRAQQLLKLDRTTRSDENVRWDEMRQERGKEDKARVALEVMKRDDIKRWDKKDEEEDLCVDASKEEHLCERKRGKSCDWW